MDNLPLDGEVGDWDALKQEGQSPADRERKAAWDKAKAVTEIVTDKDGRRYEVTKKICKYQKERAATAVDVRAKWKRFDLETNGSDTQDLVSREPPIVLELGNVDPVERMARDEVMRLMSEVERMRITVADPALARHIKEAEEQASGQGEQGKEATWAEAHSKTLAPAKDETERRLRISNISDDITTMELQNIFNTDEYRTEHIFLSKDRNTQNNRGYAFITFQTPEQAERCLARTERKIRFKNTVMHIERALPEGHKKSKWDSHS
ncbi:putative RNA-binding protein [Trypanosoma vivax]|nr:putative RNA-binding protein [Trypanosoma vivax]